MSKILGEEVVCTGRLSSMLEVGLSVSFLKKCGASPIQETPRGAYWRLSDVDLIRKAVASAILSGSKGDANA